MLKNINKEVPDLIPWPWTGIQPIKRGLCIPLSLWRSICTWNTYLTMLRWGLHQFHLLVHRSEPQLGGFAGPGSTGCQWLNCPVFAAVQVRRLSDSRWGLTHPEKRHDTRQSVSKSHTLAWSNGNNSLNYIHYISNTNTSFDKLSTISYVSYRKSNKNSSVSISTIQESNLGCAVFFFFCQSIKQVRMALTD